MKVIKAILQSHAVRRVVRALHELPHFPMFTLSGVLGQGRWRGQSGAFVINEPSLFLHSRKIPDIFAAEEAAPGIVDAIRATPARATQATALLSSPRSSKPFVFAPAKRKTARFNRIHRHA